MDMLRFIWFFLLLALPALGEQIPVLVSIAPQKFIVEQIGKENVSVSVIVPTSASSHSYEPSPRQIVAMKEGKIWFRLGETFEERLLKVLPHTLIIDQRDGIDLIGCSCCTGGGADPHTWLSPRLLVIQARQIANVLASYDPPHAKLYQQNFIKLERELVALDQEMRRVLSEAPKTLLVSHPAFGYLCRDYGLEQLTIEMEGREPTPRYLTALIAKARKLNIKTVFVQKQHAVRGGERVAKELGVPCVTLDPYAENVIENLKEIAQAFRQ